MINSDAGRTTSGTARKQAGDSREFIFTQEMIDGHSTSIASLLPAWRQLIKSASYPNVFFEPEFLLPAIRHLAGTLPVELCLIWRSDANPRGDINPTRELVGLMPVISRRWFRGLPIRNGMVWRHLHLFLSVPLFSDEHLHELIPWWLTTFNTAPARWSALEIKWLMGEGRLHRELHDALSSTQTLVAPFERFSRAILRPREHAQDYIDQAVSKGHQKSLRRLSRRLAEQGQLSLTWCDAHADPARWAQEFIDLEAKGWKGREKTAFANDPAEQAFFVDMITQMHQANKLLASCLRLDDNPIAMRFAFLSPPGSFAFKITYDESFKQFSPGLLLEIENIAKFHQLAGKVDRTPSSPASFFGFRTLVGNEPALPAEQLEWMDSCADQDATMFERVWLDRVMIESMIISSGTLSGNAIVSLFPVARFAKRIVRSLVRET